MSAYGTMYYVDNMKKAVEFYAKKLGLKPRFKSDDWTEFAAGDHAVCLHIKDRSRKVKDGGTLILNAKGVKALHAKLKKSKVTVHEPHEVHPGHWSFTVEDPSGNQLSYYGTP